MVSRRNRKIAPKRLGRKQTKKNWFQKLMYGGVVPKSLLRQQILKKAIVNQLLELGSKEHIELGFDTNYCLYDIAKLKRLFLAFKIGKKIYLIIKNSDGNDIIKPLFELVKDENGYYVIREIKQVDTPDTPPGTYELSEYTENILDVNIGKPTTYADSNLKKMIDKELAELEEFVSDASVAVSGASAAVSGASASRAFRTKLSRTASNEEMEAFEKELADFNPNKLDKDEMVASVKKANAQAKKAMSEGASQIAKLKDTRTKLERTRDIAIDIFKLGSEITELNNKIQQFRTLLRKEHDVARISQIKAKITELTAKVGEKKAERDEMLQVQQQISFTGGATRKKNHKKRKHHPSKHTVKSK